MHQDTQVLLCATAVQHVSSQPVLVTRAVPPQLQDLNFPLLNIRKFFSTHLPKLLKSL